VIFTLGWRAFSWRNYPARKNTWVRFQALAYRVRLSAILIVVSLESLEHAVSLLIVIDYSSGGCHSDPEESLGFGKRIGQIQFWKFF
jgi:hypothetical protein